MGIKCGIVGLPNVGKSTLFNAVTATQSAEAANYPFCTIEPNVALVAVPDPRLPMLAKIAGSAKLIPVQIEFVDIAGLVKGASKGEGLGNQFLSHIREVDAIIHVVRCFEDENITHVENSIHPVRDAEIIETELALADLESMEKRIQNFEKKAKNDPKLKDELEFMKRVLKLLEEGKPTRILADSEENALMLKNLQLLTSKPIMYVCNVAEEDAATGNKYTEEFAKKAQSEGALIVIISSKIEAEISTLETDEEKKEFLGDLGLRETGLARLIRAAYQLLNLTTFFTIGPKEAHAWTVKKNSTAPKAAGEIHTDFEKGFIRSETISYEDYVKYQGETKAKEAGRMRLEGKEYIVQDGDVLHFRFNV